jgi:signal peptide peptidase SppA
MPLPKPKKDEGHDDFINRCMGSDVMKKEYPDTDQRYAICQRQWADRHKKSQRDYSHIIAAFYSTIWAIMPDKLAAISEFLDLKSVGLSGPPIEAANPRSNVEYNKGQKKAVAVLPLFGTISHRMNMMSAMSGGTSTELFGKAFDEHLADDEVGTIIIDVDSPGGSVTGVTELWSKIYAGRKEKRIIAIANGLMASAAYWIASAASDVMAIPSGAIGSVGVYAIHTDYSEADKQAGVKRTIISAGDYKTEANQSQPLSDDARVHLQHRVHEYYDMMTADIARGRGIKQSGVKETFGQGRMFSTKDAKQRGMIDRTGSLEKLLKGQLPPSAEKMKAYRDDIAQIQVS